MRTGDTLNSFSDGKPVSIQHPYEEFAKYRLGFPGMLNRLFPNFALNFAGRSNISFAVYALDGFPIRHLKSCNSDPGIPAKAELSFNVLTANVSSPMSLIRFLMIVLLFSISAR